MPDRRVLAVFHAGGEIVWDNGSPIYIGGCPKMAFLKMDTTYSALVQKICDLSNSKKLPYIPIVQYLHQHGNVCTLVRISNDEDVDIMFRASARDANAIYLYIQTSAVNELDHQWHKHRVGSSQGIPPSSPPSILGKRNAARELLTHHRESNTNIGDNEDVIFNNTLPSPKVNPTRIGSDLVPKPTNVVRDLFMKHSYPPVDLGADCDLPFSEGGYSCREEENLTSEYNVGLGTDRENLVSPHADNEGCTEVGYTCVGEELPFATSGVRLWNDSENLESLHLETESCKEGPTGCGTGFTGQAECYLEKTQTRSAAFTFLDIPSNDSLGHNLNTAATEGVPNQGGKCLRREEEIIDNMLASDDLISTPPHEDSPHEMWKGRVFNSRDAFKNILAKFAMYKNFCLKPIRTNRFEATARCINSTCPWRIHASIVEDGPQFQVRTYNPEHNCTGPLNKTNYPQATSGLIAEFIRERLRVHKDYKPKEIMSDFQREFGVQISYRKAHMAKEMAMKQIRGSFEESYRILCDYRLELKRTNPGTVDNLWTEDDHSFQRYYVCFGGCARSFKSSIRPLIALDGTHLRGKYPGALLIAVCQDGDHGLFPLAVGIVESECYATWSWFIANLDETLGHVQNLTIVSDRMKGLTNAVKDVLPTANHCYCCRHISQNIQAKFKNDGIVMKFWCAARSTRVCEYENYMAEIRSIDAGAHDYINTIGRHHWANAFIEGRRYDMLTTNIAESTNSLLKDIRELPITQQIESIRAKLMAFYRLRHEKGINMKTRVTPYVDKLMNREKEASRRLQCWQAGELEFQVLSPGYTDVVHLDRMACTCRKWDLLGIPCAHALCAIELKRYDPHDFCEQWFSSECYRATYNDVIHATRDSKQWELRSDELVLPPVARRQPGRPKKCRIRTEDRMRKQVTCSHCNKRGHNRQTCREPPPRG